MRRRGALEVECARGTRGWSPARAELRRWAAAALGRRGAGAQLGVRIASASESRRLNLRWRGMDRPTNVLSFPADAAACAAAAGTGPVLLGDLVVCPAVVRAEARAQGKALRAHWAHLVVHGALHLVGYDHERSADARRMERREVAVLRGLGFANPYRSPL